MPEDMRIIKMLLYSRMEDYIVKLEATYCSILLKSHSHSRLTSFLFIYLFARIACENKNYLSEMRDTIFAEFPVIQLFFSSNLILPVLLKNVNLFEFSL